MNTRGALLRADPFINCAEAGAVGSVVRSIRERRVLGVAMCPVATCGTI